MGIRDSGQRNKGNKDRELNIIVVYNNGKIKEMTRKLKEVAEKLGECGEQVVIVGDMNARIGHWQIREEGEAERGRQSMDKTVNYEGKKLVECCEEIGGRILNGAVSGDWEGMYTYNGESSESVLDLVIELECGREGLIREMRVMPRIETDHFPIEMYIEKKEKESEGDYSDKAGKEGKEERLRWMGEKKEEYAKRMREKWETVEGTGAGTQER